VRWIGRNTGPWPGRPGLRARHPQNWAVKTGRAGLIRRPKAGSAPPDGSAKVFEVFFKILWPAGRIRAPKNDEKARQYGLKRLSQPCCFSRLTSRGAEAYIRPIGAPFRKLRLDGAPLKLLTGSVKMPPMVFGSMSFDDAFRYLAVWQVGFSDPGLFDK